jgi:hypothetical protein
MCNLYNLLFLIFCALAVDMTAALLQDDVHNYESRLAPTGRPELFRYGSAGLGIDLTAEAWPDLEQVFLSGGKGLFRDVPYRPECPQVPDVRRLPNTFLDDQPIDLLAWGDLTVEKHAAWLSRITRAEFKPSLVFEFWQEDQLFSEAGPVSKIQVTKWEEVHYRSTCRLINATQMGGVVDRNWLVVIHDRARSEQQDLSWPKLGPLVSRPMNNCLRPSGIPYSAYRSEQTEARLRHDIGERIPHCEKDPMPAWPGTVIDTPKRLCRLLNDELARGQGTPKDWLGGAYPRSETVRSTVSVHLLEYLSDFMVSGLDSTTISSESLEDKFEIDSDDDHPPFSWKPQDLAPRSAWTKARTYNLIQAALKYEDPGRLIEDGMRMLRRHRTNYTAEGPKSTHLQLLWWEFPMESWDELREGCSMNFLTPPKELITPNSEMTAEQVTIAEEFVEELVSLGVLIRVQPGEMVTNGPLFCLPKPGQPGQWRILSDMRRGGQNETIGADPTVFPKSGVILDQLYTAGFSAVVDASKFFYHFRTKPRERKYLGCIHPRRAEEHMVYAGLPMGGGNSPSIAGRHGAALLRKIQDISPLYRGIPAANTWWRFYSTGTEYQSELGHGLVYIGDDGLPAVRVWGHCDDFLIHGPTYQKTADALAAFLDLTVQVGLLCHPGKLTPPAHVVKYTGLLFDTTSTPTLRVPEYKRAKAVAMIEFAINHRQKLSRLGLAVVVGVLESLVDATPSRIGHTYLRNVQETLHPKGWDGSDLPYYSFTKLRDIDCQDLELWRWILERNDG